MSVPSAPLQEAVEAHLRASSPLLAAMGLANVRIYDVAPTDAPYPHIVFGDDQLVDASAECAEGYDAFLTFHIWTRSEPPSLLPAKRIAAALVNALLLGLEIGDYSLVDILHEDTRTFADLNEVIAHSIVTIRVLLEPVN